MTTNTAPAEDANVYTDDDETGSEHPRVREFNDGLTAADRAEAILTTIIKAKGGSRREGQVQMAREVATSLSEQKPLLVQGGTGIGKALDINTPIPTPSGFQRMGDLRVGDLVFNELGLAVRVTEAFDYLENRDCYRITFSDGSEIIADGSHQWTTETIASVIGASAWAGASTLTTTEIAATLRNSAGRANHRIPVAAPLATQHAELPLDPYALGAYLAGLNTRGDAAYARGGNLATRSLTVETPTGHTTAVGKLSDAERNHRVRLSFSDAETATISALLGEDPHIPETYLFASIPQRRALMAGMLDVSGNVVGNNQVRFQDHREAVATDFLALAASLGYRASLGKRKDCQNVWIVSFSTGDRLFRVEHKNAQVKPLDHVSVPRRTIVAVEKVPSRTVRCISVDSPRHLFLAGRSMIPTHNSIAYLAGALASGRQAVIAPHTKALQDQLREDLDLIISAFPEGSDGVIPTPTYAVVKGRSSYACLSKVKGGGVGEPPEPQELLSADGAIAGAAGGPTSKLGQDVKRLHEWVDTTETGERSDLPWPVSSKAWDQVSTTSSDCLGRSCDFHEKCFANIQRALAFKSDIIVVNQAFLAAWMRTPQILPGTISAVIVDEAHEFNGVVADSFGSNITPGRIEHTVSRALSALTQAGAKDRAEVGAQEAKDAAEMLSKKLVIKDKWERTSMDLPALVSEEIDTVTAKLSRLREQASGYIGTATEQDKAKKDNLLREMDNLMGDLRMVRQGRDDQQVVWAEKGPNGKVGLRAARFDVSDTIFQALLYKIRSVVFTSATLTIAGNFSLTAANFGFDKGPWKGAVVESPFDYERQGLIWLPEGMPEPGPREKGVAYTKKVAEVAERTVRAAGGRTLVLCTSNASVRAVSEHLSTVFSPSEHKVLAQGVGDLSAKALAKEFTEDPRAVLVGTRTFWTGISIEGDTCAAVIIDKVPFPVPSEPIVKARSEKADKVQGRGAGFKTVSLAEACLTMVQGAGRLVRTVKDRGVIVICDPRLHPGGEHMKFYAPGMMQSLPPFPVTHDAARAEAMLKEIDATANDTEMSLEVEEESDE